MADPTAREDVLTRLADRLDIREVVDAYAHHADRRNAEGQAAVFAEDGQVRLFNGDPSTSTPFQIITGRPALTTTFAELIEQYDATTYLNGQSVIEVSGDSANGESYCLAHHLLHQDGQRMLVTMSIRYLDQFAREPEGWRITRRDLVFDWTDTRPSPER